MAALPASNLDMSDAGREEIIRNQRAPSLGTLAIKA
tara:strand:- start:12 stop:119 length:108 start_codon:yes stop_codon:yes gene_type:complete